MGYAVRGNMEFSGNFNFSENFDPYEGSYYLISVEAEEVLLVANGHLDEVKKNIKTNKKCIEGDWWEEYIEYRYESIGSDTCFINVTGDFAFELNESDDLDGYDVDPGDCPTAIIGWAIDGDSPKILGFCNQLEGGLVESEEDDEFEEL